MRSQFLSLSYMSIKQHNSLNITGKCYCELNAESTILETMSDLNLKTLLIEKDESLLLLIKNYNMEELLLLYKFIRYQIFKEAMEGLITKITLSFIAKEMSLFITDTVFQ